MAAEVNGGNCYRPTRRASMLQKNPLCLRVLSARASLHLDAREGGRCHEEKNVKKWMDAHRDSPTVKKWTPIEVSRARRDAPT